MDLILQDVLPNALAIGVPYDLFWVLNPKELEPFHKAFSLTQEFNQEMNDINNWQLGNYIRYAVSSVMSEKSKYPTKPFSQEERELERLSEEEKLEKGRENNQLVREMLLDRINKRKKFHGE